MNWKTTTFLFCLYGIIKKFRPATPFLTPYLVSDKNLTLEQVYGDVYPYWTYSYMICLIPVFFLTDILRYKPIIVLEAICLIGTWMLLLYGQGVVQMQMMQIIFGLSSASEIAYYSYMYAVVDEKRYKTATSYIRSAAMVGKLLAYSIGQLLISTGIGSYLLLNQISLASVISVTLIAFFLPPVPSPNEDAKVFIEESNNQNEENLLTRFEVEKKKMNNGLRCYFNNTINNLFVFVNNKTVLRWSIWWALASCGIFQVFNYIQSLWLTLQEDPQRGDNGIVEFVHTLTGAVTSFIIQYLSIDWKKYGEITLCLSSLLISATLFLLSQTSILFLSYAGYIICSTIYSMLITAASSNIAMELTSSNYGFVFGMNTFAALTLQTSLTLLVVDSHGFNLSIRSQFIVYSGYFACVSCVFFVLMAIGEVRRKQSSHMSSRRVDT